jgi:membrane-associated phospholipid phosphatase
MSEVRTGGSPRTMADDALAVGRDERLARRRRRPTGAPPPLPHSIGVSGKGWLAALVVLVVWVVVTLVSPLARRCTDQVDALILRSFASVRTGWGTALARAIDRMATGWTLSVAAGLLLVAMVGFKRWRHLFTYLGSVLLLRFLGGLLVEAFNRPRPYDVTIIGRWRGFSLPSVTVGIVSYLVVGVIYAMVVPGRPRSTAKVIGIVVVGLVAVSRLYLAIDHPFDVLVGAALGVAIPLNAFRLFTPSAVFPVTYRGGKTAHLDVEGRRGEALRRAVEEQLGVTIVDVKPVGLAGSGGSTPLRLRVAGGSGGANTFLFGKLYAMNHVRADRWYKLGRTILYGRLEDETPFGSVRRLVQYEDYALHLVRGAGIATAAPLGVVELTPEREYLLVTEFFDGALEIGDADVNVDDGLIDEGLRLVRQLWDAGLAHRDIKPANLLVRDGHLLVIDLAFVQVRPSPWRQAVDLANMMLVLAVRTDPTRVYQRALAYFTPDEIAEAFAAARGIASPTQLRAALKKDGRNLVSQFRALAPPRRPIPLQRWSVRRVLLGAAVLAVTAVALQNAFGMFTPTELPIGDDPSCGTGDLMILMAQSAPGASVLPCVAALPTGVEVDHVRVNQDGTHFRLTAGGDGPQVDVTLLRLVDCALAGTEEVPSDEPGTQRFEAAQPRAGEPLVRSYRAGAVCIIYRYDLGTQGAAIMPLVDAALAFQPRAPLVQEIEHRSGLVLCGAGAPPCAGAAR